MIPTHDYHILHHKNDLEQHSTAVMYTNLVVVVCEKYMTLKDLTWATKEAKEHKTHKLHLIMK